MKSQPAFAIAQYVAGSVELNTVPPVTFPPSFIFAITGFQIFASAGGLVFGPNFHVASSGNPVFTAPAGATFIAPLSLPAGAANGNFSFPASGLLAYGSAFALGAAAGVFAVT